MESSPMPCSSGKRKADDIVQDAGPKRQKLSPESGKRRENGLLDSPRVTVSPESGRRRENGLLDSPRVTVSPESGKRENGLLGSPRVTVSPESGVRRENGLLDSPQVTVSSEHVQKAITEKELLELLHYSAVDKTRGLVHRPSWCRLHKQRLLKAVSVAVVDHVSQSDFYEHYLSMPNLRNKYSTRVTLAASSSNLLSEIFTSQVSVKLRVTNKPDKPHPQRVLSNHPVIRKFGTERKGLTAYLLSTDELSKHNYPLTGQPGCEDFVRTDSESVVTDSSPLFGLDCEMCLTVKGNELTRVSLVDSTGTCVLDQLVKPDNKIINYLTQFSGVTRQMLCSVKTTLSDVQSRILALLPRDAVLVGHSMDNDLRALKMIHPHVIDTSLLYKKEFGQRFKLKVLAETLLQKQIQTDDRKGHDPCEDAAAALELAQYFINNGPLKIVQEHQKELWGYSLDEQKKERTQPLPSRPTSVRLVDVLQNSGRSVTFFGKRSDIDLHVSNQQWFSSDRQVLQGFRDQPKQPFFSVLQFCPGQTGGAVLTTQTCPLSSLCVVFAGPLPPHFSEEDVARLFCCCGPLETVRTIYTATRVHAEVHFQLPESALLALSALNGLTLHGHCIKVQRPMNEASLDAEVTVEALQTDLLTRKLLYVVSISPDIAEQLQASTTEPIHTAGSSGPVQVNGLKTHRGPGLSLGDLLLDTFSRFGPVARIIRPPQTGEHFTPSHTGEHAANATHAYVEFVSVDSRDAACSSSQDLLQLNYLLCPAVTPPHLSAWRTAHTTVENTGRTCTALTNTTVARSLRKLDRRLGKVFRSLPHSTLSVVVLRGSQDSAGLVFLEVKHAS